MEIKHDGQGKVFENPFLESLTKTHIAIPLTIFYGSGFGILIYEIIKTSTPYYWLLAVFLTGILGFTLFEYFFHRLVFHLPATTPRRAALQHKLHGVHHEYPRDKKRLAMPPVISVILAFFLLSFFNFLNGTFGLAFGGGFLAGYASYLFVHYSVHAFTPPRNFIRVLWMHHSYHHYKDQKLAFGVSSPLWDHVFGTAPRLK